MRNLIDDLHELNNVEYNVSQDFSKNVMEAINYEKRMKKIKHITSLVSVACTILVTVFIIGKADLLSRFAKPNNESADNIVNTSGQLNSKAEVTSSEAVLESGLNVPDVAIEESASKEKRLNISPSSAVSKDEAINNTFFDDKNEDTLKKIKTVLDENKILYSVDDGIVKVQTNLEIEDIKNMLHNINTKVIYKENGFIIIDF